MKGQHEKQTEESTISPPGPFREISESKSDAVWGALMRCDGVDAFRDGSALLFKFNDLNTAPSYISSPFQLLNYMTAFWLRFCIMSPKKDDSHKAASQPTSSAASSEAILAAIANQGAELDKVCRLMTDLENSMEGRLDSIDTTLTTLQREHGETKRRMDSMDEALSTNDTRITALEATCNELQVANGILKTKLNDLEGRSRRLNIRIVGIKEGQEDGRPSEFVSRLILELLGQDNFSKPVKIDRAHRSLRPKPSPNERPRVIIAKVHNDRDVGNIFWLARQQARYSTRSREFPSIRTTLLRPTPVLQCSEEKAHRCRCQMHAALPSQTSSGLQQRNQHLWISS